MRVLSIDPALRKTGFAILEETSPKTYKSLCYGVIQNKPKLRQSMCLVAIREALTDVIEKFKPDCCAIEAIIYVQSHATAIIMGAARGAALLTAAEAGLSITEYAPRRVKQAVVGRGGADKSQVAYMMRALLGLTETPPPDAADALAIGLAHLYATDPLRAIKPASKDL
ncbi:MAG: crossover junction endodeoxyribonuclease RuvC [Verrucomicrobiales bacterium]|jgi:crossover junction endodeoxyribonuclease RuvC